MSRNRGRNRFDITTGKPSRGYIIFVLAMAGFLVVGSVALIVGTAFEGGDDRSRSEIDTRPGEEIARLETAVAEDPTDTDSMAVLANILATSGRPGDAVGWYERAVIADPENGDLRVAFGLALFELRNDFDAAVQFRRALELLPDSASPPYYLGRIAERSSDGDIDDARRWYEEAVELAPDSLVGQQAQERLDGLETSMPTATP